MTEVPVIRSVGTARDLPPEWDGWVPHGLLRREWLRLLEEVNPCAQRYLWAGAGDDVSLAVTYRLRLRPPWRVVPHPAWPVTVVGVPASVAVGGLVLGAAGAAPLLEQLRRRRGVTLVLNHPTGSLAGFAAAPTLCTWTLPVAWRSFDAYLGALRSGYRRRIRQALERGRRVEVRRIDPDRFDDSWYRLYAAVRARSRYPLETLAPAFFRRAPAQIDGLLLDGRPLGFVQTRREGATLQFLFGGLDYALEAACDTYWNLLLHLVRRAIEEGCDRLELGQTANTVKQRLGARPEALWAGCAHRVAVVGWLFRAGLRLAMARDRPPAGARVWHGSGPDAGGPGQGRGG